MSCIQIIETGFYTTIQDQGRLGYAHMGVPESGAMDKQALSFANLLLNNQKNAAGLECTLVGPKILFMKDCAFVLTGAITSASLDAEILKMDAVYLARKGQILEVGKVKNGCRSYLGLDGGVEIQDILGSKSLFYPITSKGYIEKGDTFKTGLPNYGNHKGLRVQIKKDKPTPSITTLEAFKGPEYDYLSSEGRAQLVTKEFTIGSWNRMGIELHNPLESKMPKVLTGPVMPGTVQLTPSGKLYTLMRDCQVTGGYPRILQLSEASINLLAQKKTGDILKLSLH